MLEHAPRFDAIQKKEVKNELPVVYPLEKLHTIETAEFDGDDIAVFTDGLLSQLAHFTKEMGGRYRAEYPTVELTDKEAEDQALAHYELDSVPALLNKIQNKIDQIDGVKQFISTHTKISESIFIPTEATSQIRLEKNSSINQAPPADRLTTLVYILLSELNVQKEDIEIIKGKNDPEGWRNEPYYRINIRVAKNQDRIVYVCNEAKNSTFIFDTRALMQEGFLADNDSELDGMNKTQLNELVELMPEAGIRLRHSSNWRRYIADVLINPISKTAIYEQQQYSRYIAQKQEDPLLPKVSYAELDLWRHFWTDDSGQHWGTASAITKKLNGRRCAKRIGKMVDEENLKKPGSIRSRKLLAHGNELIGYCYEDFLNLGILEEIHLVREDTGLQTYTDPETGERYTTIRSYASATKKYHTSLAEKLKLYIAAGNQVPKLQAHRSGQKEKVSIYPVSILQKIVDIRVTEGRIITSIGKDAPSGLVEHDGKIFGSQAAIIEKLNAAGYSIGYDVFLRIREGYDELKIATLPIKVKRGITITGYCYEDVLAILSQLPTCEASGDFAGFATIDGQHFASPPKIAARLGKDISTIKRRIDIAPELIKKHKILPANNVIVTGYCLEDIAKLI